MYSLHDFMSSADFFIKFRNMIRLSNSLDPDQAQQFLGPDLGPNCLQRSSVDDTGKQNIPDKIRNATRRNDQLSGRSQVMGQFRLYRRKGMSGTAALHIVCNQASKICTRKLAKIQVGVKL